MPAQVVVAPPARAAMFLTLTVPEGSERAVRGVLAGVSDLAKSVSFRDPSAELHMVAGIGSTMWDRMIASVPRPKDLKVFPGVAGAKHVAPSTPGDIFFHLRAGHMDQCFEFARLVMLQLGDNARVVDEVHGFKYFDNRDLLGFVDGTANPQGKAAYSSVLVSDELDSDYAGSSYLVVQKYIHDLAAWEKLSVEEQERVIGRYKLNDVEIPDDLKATDSHVALNTITDENGVEHDIMRDNMPFGELGAEEFGTYFISYAGNPLVTEQMLQNMFVGRPEGNYDRILDFSTAVTGNLFFVPTQDFLDGIDDLDLPAAAAAEPDPGEVPPVPGHIEDSELLGPPTRIGADDQTTPDANIGLDLLGTRRAAPSPMRGVGRITPADEAIAPGAVEPADASGSPDDASDTADAGADADESLGLGSLRRRGD